jgi:hypothetical protein
MTEAQWTSTIKYILKSNLKNWRTLGPAVQYCQYNIGIPDLVMVVREADGKEGRFTLLYGDLEFLIPKKYDLTEWFAKARKVTVALLDKKDKDYESNVKQQMINSMHGKYIKEADNFRGSK